MPTQPSLRRMREHDVRPRRDLGQNFLVDSNILGVIERLAGLEPQDVVLEVGGGLGRAQRAPRAALRARARRRDRHGARARAARRRSRRCANTTLHVADAMELDLAALDPAPTKVVANLPYGIAAGAILRTIEELPVRDALGRDGAEGGRRPARRARRRRALRRPVRDRAARLRRRGRAARSRASVFVPVPNVDSVLVRLERTGPRALARAAAADPRRRSRTGARRCRARSSCPAGSPGRAGRTSGRAPARRSRRSAIRPTSAPSASRPRSSATLLEQLQP